MASKIATILALSSIALAHPRKHHHFGTGYGTGTGGGFPQPTGSVPFPLNGTDGIGAGSPTGSSAVISVTVQPIAASTSVEAASIGMSSDAATFGNLAASSSGIPVEAASSDATCSSSTTTSTATTVQYVTVTAGADSSSSGGFDGSVPSISDPVPSATDIDAFSTSLTATVSAIDVDALSTSLTATVSAISLTSTASAVSLTSTISVSAAAGEFYGGHSYSYSGGYSQQSSAAVASSSVAFSASAIPTYGQSSSAVASVVPTTFATLSGSLPSVSAASSYASSALASSSVAMPSASSTLTPTTSGSSSGKKGLSYNSASVLSAFSGDGMSWAYNWGSGADGTIPSGMEYVPMCWGLSSTGSWAAAASSAIASGSSHVLSFNEPDLGAQSNIDPATAAKNHITYLNPLSGSAQIGSPAITNGAGTSPLMGIDWLNSFFSSCANNCKVDFVAFHWYDAASNLAYFKSHVQDVIDAAAKNGVSKVWLTEFGASGSDSDVANFITEATAFLDGTPAVERYAYFMASDGILLSGSGLSTLGKAYAG